MRSRCAVVSSRLETSPRSRARSRSLAERCVRSMKGEGRPPGRQPHLRAGRRPGRQADQATPDQRAAQHPGIAARVHRMLVPLQAEDQQGTEPKPHRGARRHQRPVRLPHSVSPNQHRRTPMCPQLRAKRGGVPDHERMTEPFALGLPRWRKELPEQPEACGPSPGFDTACQQALSRLATQPAGCRHRGDTAGAAAWGRSGHRARTRVRTRPSSWPDHHSDGVRRSEAGAHAQKAGGREPANE